MRIENIQIGSEELTELELEEERQLRLLEIRFNITRNYSLVLASLAKESGVKIRLDDESEATYFAPESMEIVVSTKLIDKFGLEKEDQIFTTIHEYGHLADYSQDPKFYLQTFERVQKETVKVIEAARQVITAKGDKFTPIMEANLTRQTEKALAYFRNIFDDIGVNRWAESQIPSLKTANSLDRIYSQHAFPDEKSEDGELLGFVDYSKLARHKQFQSALLRRTMCQSSTTLISAKVDELLNNKTIKVKGYFDLLSITETVTGLSEINQNQGKAASFLPFAQKFQGFMDYVLPTFIEIYTQDWLDALENRKDDKTPEEIKDELNEPPKKPKQKEDGDEDKDEKTENDADEKNEPEDGEENSNKNNEPDVDDGEGESNSEPINAGDDLFRSDVDDQNIPSIFTPTTKEELEKLEKDFKIFKGKLEQSIKDEQVMDPQAQYYEYLTSNYPITLEQIRDYNEYAEKGKISAKELQKVFDRLLGLHRQEGVITRELRNTGPKINISSVVKNITQIRQGNSELPIYENSVYGTTEGKEKPKEIIFHLVIDTSGSMGFDGEIETMREIYAILCGGIKNYTTRANLKGLGGNNEFIRLRTQVWRYDKIVQEIKPLSNKDPKVDDTPTIIGAFEKIQADGDATNDPLMIKTLSNSIFRQTKNVKNKIEVDTQNVILYFTDGGSSDPNSMIKELRKGSQLPNTIWRGFNISNELDSDFDRVWNRSVINNVRGQCVSVDNLISVFVEQFREILE